MPMWDSKPCLVVLPRGALEMPALFQRMSRRDSWARNCLAFSEMVVRSFRSRRRLLSCVGLFCGGAGAIDLIYLIAVAILSVERLAM